MAIVLHNMGVCNCVCVWEREREREHAHTNTGWGGIEAAEDKIGNFRSLGLIDMMIES